jgi:hypothetical protein
MVSPQNEPDWQNHYAPPKAEIGPTRSNNDRTVGRSAVVIRGVLGILGILGSWSLLGTFIGVVIQDIYVWWCYQGGTRETFGCHHDEDFAFLLGWFAGGVIGTTKTLAWTFAQGAKTRSATNRVNAKADVFHKDDDLAAVSVHAQGGHPPLGGS